jgi:hypothetical protein
MDKETKQRKYKVFFSRVFDSYFKISSDGDIEEIKKEVKR